MLYLFLMVHMLQIGKNLWLGGKAFPPGPFLLEVLGEGIGVFQALHIAAGARIAIPVPGATHVGARLDHLRVKACPPQAVQQIKPGKAGTHDDHVAKPVLIGARCSGVGHGYIIPVGGSASGRPQASPIWVQTVLAWRYSST